MAAFEDSAFDGHERVVFCHDRDTGLKAIIAIPLDGTRPCRWWHATVVLRIGR